MRGVRKNVWIILSVLLIVAIVSGGVVFGIRQFGSDSSIEITPPPATVSTLQVHLTGAVANDGIYTFYDNSSLGDILRIAGYYPDDADTTSIVIHIIVDAGDSAAEPQKININKAESWLLEALPAIGPTLAQRIIDYRETEGFFNSIDELAQVDGIGALTLEKIRDKITVID
jgi:competence protein ComEA